MNIRLLVAVVLALGLSACTSMRVSGVVTDQVTGEPVGRAGIVSGPRSAWSDPVGRFRLGVDRSWKSMQVIAEGYETQDVPFADAKTRYPVYNVRLVPKTGRSAAARTASPASERSASAVHPVADTETSR